jgi:uncharacterized protein YqeY
VFFGQKDLQQCLVIEQLIEQVFPHIKMHRVQNKREDLAQVERDELAVIEKYLPKQLSEIEIKNILQELVTNAGATTSADFGKVMPLAMKALAGKADGKIISSVLKEILS